MLGYTIPSKRISIHAPTRGATRQKLSLSHAGIISIHAPTRGATIFYCSKLSPIHYFNPRTHEGCDSLMTGGNDMAKNFNPRTHEGCDSTRTNILLKHRISIHAPTRGATKNVFYSGAINMIFQSTHPRGVRQPLQYVLYFFF